MPRSAFANSTITSINSNFFRLASTALRRSVVIVFFGTGNDNAFFFVLRDGIILTPFLSLQSGYLTRSLRRSGFTIRGNVRD